MQAQVPGAELTTRDQQREETRLRVRDAAVRVFRRDGFDAARIDDVAKEAGVSRGTFYFHFPTKDDVLLDMLREAERRVTKSLAKLPPSAPTKKVLARFCLRFAREWEGERDLFPYVGAVAVRRAAGAFGGKGEKDDPVRFVLAQYFRAAVARKELTTSVPPPVLADFFLMNAFSAALAWCAMPGVPLSDALRAVAVIFLNGARARKR
jgi:AcrR family transcriptional regulator